MRAALLLAVALATVVSTQGACPNRCSGHGSCGADDVCSCYPNWQEGDCSLRTCPYTKAWADILDTTVTGRETHHYAECGGRGRCDRSSGECVCDEGFEGEGCDRLSCAGGPNCNGHGTCELMSTVNTYTGWDADKIQICQCDPGYTGHDCSERKCKMGNDPLSLYSASATLEVDEVQRVTISTTGTFDAGSQFTLKYTDWRGNVWVTRPIDTDTLSVISITEALTTLPQRAIDSVTVTIGTNTGASKIFDVTFSSAETPGDQPMLELDVSGCTDHGCQPYSAGVTGGTVSSSVAEQTKGTAERQECSGRGICDAEVGVCKCYPGFFGEACHKQTLVL